MIIIVWRFKKHFKHCSMWECHSLLQQYHHFVTYILWSAPLSSIWWFNLVSQKWEIGGNLLSGSIVVVTNATFFDMYAKLEPHALEIKESNQGHREDTGPSGGLRNLRDLAWWGHSINVLDPCVTLLRLLKPLTCCKGAHQVTYSPSGKAPHHQVAKSRRHEIWV